MLPRNNVVFYHIKQMCVNFVSYNLTILAEKRVQQNTHTGLGFVEILYPPVQTISEEKDTLQR